MARFRFKLQPLLDLRRRDERAAQRDVAEHERRRRELEDALRAEQRLIVTGKRDLGQQLVGPLEMNGLRAQAGSTIDRMRRAQRLVLDLAGVHKRLDAARAVLIEAMRERRAVELLRERRWQQWKSRIERAEDAALDELAVQSAARKELEA